MSTKRITPEQEYAICLRRGHSVFMAEKWNQCKWCLRWLREIRTIEERKDEPPVEEQHFSSQLLRGRVEPLSLKAALKNKIETKAKR